MRVVSLACSNTEIIAGLGCGHMLVGVDEHSDSPAELVAKLPKVGPDLTIDIKKVAELKPDLVLATLTVPGHEKNIEGLQKAALNYIAPEPVSLADVFDNIRQIASLLGKDEKGSELVAKMKAELEPVSSKLKPKILVQWWNKPTISPAKLSWVSDLIALAGGENPLAHEDYKSRPISNQEVAEINPDIIVLAWCGVDYKKLRPDVIYKNKLWSEVKAVKNKQVFTIPEAFLGRPGPNLVLGYKELKRIVAEFNDGIA